MNERNADLLRERERTVRLLVGWIVGEKKCCIGLGWGEGIWEFRFRQLISLKLENRKLEKIK